MTYRPDIDGLRALAILAVLAFHAHIFAAGYIGVDIFFVISGFLITSLILEDMDGVRFRFGAFYMRRIRRLFPAIVFLLCALIPTVLLAFSPSDIKVFFKSLAAFILLGSNWNFLSEAGYFDAASRTKPLLHTWSLSIEEQFYLLFPVMLVVTQPYLRKWGKYIFWGSLFFASLAFQQHLKSDGHNDAAYFNSAARFWELLAGILCAFINRDFTVSSRLSAPMSVAGIFLIMTAGPLRGYTDTLSALSMLPSVLGAALIILSGCGRVCGTNKILGAPPFVFVGKISYSLYLWHWPLLIVIPLFFPMPEARATATALSLSFAAATISYFAVERPVRNRRILGTAGALFASFAFASAGILFLCMVGFAGSGMLERLVASYLATTPIVQTDELAPPLTMDSLLAKIGTEGNGSFPPSIKCLNYDQNNILENVSKGDFCEIGVRTSGPVDMLVMGDSHIVVLYPLFEALAKKYKLRAQITGCIANPPLLGATPRDNRQHFCVDYYTRLYDYIRSIKPKHIIMISRWTGYLHGETDTDSQGMSVTDEKGNPPLVTLRAAFQRSIENVPKETDITVMSQPPEYAVEVPVEMLNMAHQASNLTDAFARIDNDDHMFVTVADEAARVQETKSMLENARTVRFIDISGTFCSEKRCIFHNNYVPLYRDSNHISAAGAQLILNRSGDLFSFLGQ